MKNNISERLIRFLKDILGQVARRQYIRKPFIHQFLRHLDLPPTLHLRGLEADFLHYALQHGVQPPRADILHSPVKVGGAFRNLSERVVVEGQRDALRVY